MNDLPLAERSTSVGSDPHALFLDRRIAKSLRRRPRVNAVITEALSRPITVIAGPAGIGKSIATQHAFESLGLQPTLIRATESSFAAMMRSLVTTVKQPSDDAQASLEEMSMADLSTWLSRRLHELGPTIVMEDLHLATRDERIALTLRHLIESTLPRTKWILITRNPEVLPTTSWLAYGLMAPIIDENVLRFSDDEAERYLRINVPFLTADERQVVAAMLDGWAVLLALTTTVPPESLQNIDIENHSRPAVFNYLTKEIIANFSEDDRHFLRWSSLFWKLDENFLWRFANVPDPRSTIRRIQRRLPLVHGAGNVFYYHKLLREYLLNELRSAGDAVYITTLRQVATICESGGWRTRAIELYSEIGDYPAIERIIIEHGLWLADHGKIDTVKRGLASIPSEYLRHPITRTLLCFIAGEEGDGRPDPDIFPQIWEEAKEEPYAAAIALRYIRGFNYRRELVPASTISTLLSTRMSAFDKGRIYRGLGLNSLRANRVAEARRYIEDGCAVFEEQYPTEEAMGSAYLAQALLAFHEHRFAVSRDYLARARSIARKYKRYPLSAQIESLAFDLAFEDDDFATARHCAQDMLGLAIAGGIPAYEQQALLHNLTIASLSCDDAETERLEALLQQHAIVDECVQARVIPIAAAMRNATKGDFKTALEFVLATEDQLTRFPELFRTRCAQGAVFAAASGQHALAERYIADVLGKQFTPQTRRDVVAVALCSLAAVLIGQQENANKLLSLSESKVTHGKAGDVFVVASRAFYCYVVDPQDATRLQFDRGVERLRAIGHNCYAEMLSQLRMHCTSKLAPDEKLALLTPAERAVFSLLTEGRTNQDIAKIRNTSVETTKDQVRKIVDKFDLSGRSELIAYAAGRKLGSNNDPAEHPA